ncbi:uncharacterized mitochondrial protein AtMg00820-like [Juglans regia]|uniref:Uncharacterized mitochondrial protein AtMg00820-like n=1 Tax=Juglans regia TaxID=51240 RepID=A0A6P9F5S5_JUGRE|nr:uncharacterized mitochondrial protein AtMg00820-like [Juglans regia]
MPSDPPLSHASSSIIPHSNPLTTHPMTTRSQTGYLKPHDLSDYQTFYSTKHPLQALTSLTMPLEPHSYKQASLLPEWHMVMQEEYDALIANQTWTLCPRPLDHNVIDNKWVYEVKQTSAGAVDRLKARLVAKGFEQDCGIVFVWP